MKNIVKTFALAFVASVVLYSCAKEPVVVQDTKAPQNTQINPEPMVPSSKYEKVHKVWITVNGVSTLLIECYDPDGNCLPKVVIKSSKLKDKLATPSSIEDYFNHIDADWEEHFTDDVINDDEFVDYMQSGNAKAVVSSIPGEDFDVYCIGPDDGTDIDEDNAEFVIPIEN